MRSRAVRRDFGVLAFDGFGASAFADFFLFVADLGHEIGESAHVGFEAERTGVNFGGEDVVDCECGGFGAFAHEGRLIETTYYISGREGGCSRLTLTI